jgi:hypothetical protein
MDGDELVKGMNSFVEALKFVKSIQVTEVTREETPDGPLHTFTKKSITLDELRDEKQGDDKVE